MSGLKVTVTGGREARVMIEGLADRAQSPGPAMRKVADELRGVHARAFASGGVNLPRPWRRLKSTTVEAKRRRGYDRRLLVRRGDLATSLSVRAHPWNVEETQGTQLRFGTRSPVARLLRARGRNPVQAPRDTRVIESILLRYIEP